MKKNILELSEGLEEYISTQNSSSFKKFHSGRTCHEAYVELKRNLLPVQQSVTTGAMADAIRKLTDSYQEKLKQILDETPDKDEQIAKTHELFAEDPVLFLNDHGPEHINMVIERANSIVTNFNTEYLSEFEAFILLCAIQIHDIGNILGRAGHERKLNSIFDERSANIIIDTPERRVIKSVAMAHGGKSEKGKDTISLLSARESIFNETVRTRLLAAILRFADELADDNTRANREAMDLGILGTNSDIYHKYSRALHTVAIKSDEENKDFKVSLVFELEAPALKDKYLVGNYEKYLLDEIYDRTQKMELERRYCMKFMYPYINIGRIQVAINIYGAQSQLIKSISYTLEDVSYPNDAVVVRDGMIGNISVPSGKEMLHVLMERGEIHEE